MVTVEVNLKEDDKPPEQHLDEGEYIERVIVPLNQLYEKLQGKSHNRSCPLVVLIQVVTILQPSQKRMARSSMPGKRP